METNRYQYAVGEIAEALVALRKKHGARATLRERRQIDGALSALESLYLEDNRGGSYIDLRPVDASDVRLTVGHQCVVPHQLNDVVVPAEFVVAALVVAIDQHGTVEAFLRSLGYESAYTDSLVARVRKAP